MNGRASSRPRTSSRWPLRCPVAGLLLFVLTAFPLRPILSTAGGSANTNFQADSAPFQARREQTRPAAYPPRLISVTEASPTCSRQPLRSPEGAHCGVLHAAVGRRREEVRRQASRRRHLAGGAEGPARRRDRPVGVG